MNDEHAFMERRHASPDYYVIFTVTGVDVEGSKTHWKVDQAVHEGTDDWTVVQAATIVMDRVVGNWVENNESGSATKNLVDASDLFFGREALPRNSQENAYNPPQVTSFFRKLFKILRFSKWR